MNYLNNLFHFRPYPSKNFEEKWLKKDPKLGHQLKIDGSTLGLFWVLFEVILGSLMVPLSHQKKMVAQLVIFFEYFLSHLSHQ
jgi:hypothetical protein